MSPTYCVRCGERIVRCACGKPDEHWVTARGPLPMGKRDTTCPRALGEGWRPHRPAASSTPTGDSQ